MCTFKIFCVTDEKQCPGDFWQQLAQIAQGKTDGIILRNKELSLNEYEKWAFQALECLASYSGLCMVHHYREAASFLGTGIHLSYSQLEEFSLAKEHGKLLGVSVHSLKQAVRAWQLGADYLVVGHIYETSCKEGLLPKGLSFLRKICQAVPIPVYGIGGIGLRDYDKIAEIRNCGAQGVCIMSGFMKSQNPVEDLFELRKFLAGEIYN